MPFNKAKHIRYWRMCSSVLPVHYTSTDSSRMTLGFFTVAALDLLGVLHDEEGAGQDETGSIVPAFTRQGWIDWIYSCQLSTGGFRGTAGMDLGRRRNGANEIWDPATVPATFFALAALLVLGDDLSGVKRDETVKWLPKLQRRDGSFGDILIGKGGGIDDNEESRIGGGRDLRYCCCAAGIAFMLHDEMETMEGIQKETIDLDAMVRYIRSCQSYSGGFGESPYQEAHSGLTYCAVAALGFVQLLRTGEVTAAGDLMGDKDGLVKWMIDRQTEVLEESEDEGDEEDDTVEAKDEAAEQRVGLSSKSSLAYSSGDVSQIVAGFNGRQGKIADTCYCWWNTGALSVIQAQQLVDADAVSKYLCDKVQHMIGGFGKGIDAPPDVLHSYLGLAALSAFGQEGLKPIDPTMCISRDAVGRLQKAKWKTKR